MPSRSAGRADAVSAAAGGRAERALKVDDARQALVVDPDRVGPERAEHHLLLRCDAIRPINAAPSRQVADAAAQSRADVERQLSVGPTGPTYLVDAVEERDEVRDVDAREALVQLKLRALSAVCCVRHVVCRTLSAAESR